MIAFRLRGETRVLRKQLFDTRLGMRVLDTVSCSVSHRCALMTSELYTDQV